MQNVSAMFLSHSAPVPFPVALGYVMSKCQTLESQKWGIVFLLPGWIEFNQHNNNVIRLSYPIQKYIVVNHSCEDENTFITRAQSLFDTVENILQ